MTYWEAADILEHGSLHYGKIQEASAIALMVLKEKIKDLDAAEIAEFREVIKDGPTEDGIHDSSYICGDRYCYCSSYGALSIESCVYTCAGCGWRFCFYLGICVGRDDFLSDPDQHGNRLIIFKKGKSYENY